MTFHVDPDTLFNASAQFLDLSVAADGLLGNLIGGLSGTAGMAGADKLGGHFAGQYDKAARAAATGLAKVDVHLGQIAAGLLSTATNYWRADAGSNMQFPIDVGTAPVQRGQCERARAYREEEVPLAQGEGIGTWDVIADTALSYLWPQGDTGKMRTAAEAWYAVATGLSRLNVQVGTSVGVVTGPNTGPSINAFASHCATLVEQVCYSAPHAGGAAIPNLEALCRQLGAFCDTAADKIEEARTKIRHMLEAAAEVAAAGLVLTIFTFGISDLVAGGIDAGIVASAEAVIIAAEDAIIAELSAEMIAEIEVYLGAVESVEVGSAGLSLVGAVTLVGGTLIVVGVGGAGTAYATPGVPGAPPPGGGLPIQSWAPLTPAQRAAFDAWKNSLPNWPETNTGPAYDYQRRVAGPNVYRVPTGDGRTIDADGLRSADGAIVDTKYTKDPSCSPYNTAGNVFAPVYQKILAGQDDEIDLYTAAVKNAANQGKFLEIDVNDPALVPYYVALMTKYHTPGRVVVIP